MEYRLQDIIYFTISKVCIRAYRPELSPVSVACSDEEYFYSPLDGMLVHHRVTPSNKFAGTHLYTCMTRSNVRVKCLAQEHSAVPRPGLEAGPLDPESSTLTIRPTRPPLQELYINTSITRVKLLVSGILKVLFCRIDSA